MQVTSNALNNKADLSKMNKQADTNNKTIKQSTEESKNNIKVVLDTITSMVEATEEVVTGDLSTTGTNDEANYQFSDEEIIRFARTRAKAEATLELAKTAIGFVEDTIELARKCLDGSTSPLELAVIMNVSEKRAKEKVNDARENVMDSIDDSQRLANLLEVDRTLAIKTSTVDNRMEEREEEREEPKFTVEDGKICHNGTSINDGTVEDTDSLITLISSILADTKVVDMSNLETYLEKLNGYKDLLLIVQHDLEHEDPTKAIEKHKEQEATYQACLSMQPNIVQATLSDYVS